MSFEADLDLKIGCFAGIYSNQRQQKRSKLYVVLVFPILMGRMGGLCRDTYKLNFSAESIPVHYPVYRTPSDTLRHKLISPHPCQRQFTNKKNMAWH
jgi:hypothetical protein